MPPNKVAITEADAAKLVSWILALDAKQQTPGARGNRRCHARLDVLKRAGRARLDSPPMHNG